MNQHVTGLRLVSQVTDAIVLCSTSPLYRRTLLARRSKAVPDSLLHLYPHCTFSLHRHDDQCRCAHVLIDHSCVFETELTQMRSDETSWVASTITTQPAPDVSLIIVSC